MTILPSVQKSSCVGAVADGQYITQRFQNAFLLELDTPKDDFSFIVWDPSHFMDQVAKKFMCEPYLKRLSERTSRFHTKLGHGKMHQIAENIGTNLGEKTLVTKSLSTTRLISSTVQSYLAVSKCFQQYTTVMYEYGGMQHNTNGIYSEDEYMVVAQDFAIDLLIVIDVLSILVSLTVKSQDLQVPCWKVVPNTHKVIDTLKNMLKDLQEVGDPQKSWNLNEARWPNSAPHHNEIFKNKRYKNVPLVDGWMVDTSVTTRKNSPVNWNVREAEDCHTDAVNFVKNLIAELKLRVRKAVPDGITHLFDALDLCNLMKLLTGEFN